MTTKTTPPVDTDGSGFDAMKLLKHFRKELGRKITDPAWQKWVADSLAAGFAGEDGDDDA